MKLSLSCLAVALFLGAVPAAPACKYCMIAAEEAESTRLSAQVSGQEFPLEGIVNKYPGPAPAASLATPPPAASVATKVSDLPVATIHRSATPPIATTAAQKVPAANAVLATGESKSSRWADAGLLGLATAGGLFCWRTRRAHPPLP